MSGIIHVGDIGTVIEVTVKDEAEDVVVLATATVKQFIFRKPDHDEVTKDATLVTDGLDGKLQYTTTVDDIDLAGDWQVQVYIENPSGKWHSDIQAFSVRDNLA
jgi:hypothetical protein